VENCQKFSKVSALVFKYMHSKLSALVYELIFQPVEREHLKICAFRLVWH
jgi:hypothetical protein